MQVKQRLQLNSTISVVAGFVIILVFVFAAHFIIQVVETSTTTGNIITSAYEMITLRNDYVESFNERARVQWFSKHEEIGQLLKSAAEKSRNSVNQAIVAEMVEDHGSIGSIFSSIVRNRGIAQDRAGMGELLLDTEKRLLTQLTTKNYDLVLNARMLQTTSREALFSVIFRSTLGIVCVLILVFAGVIFNSWFMSRSITKRINALGEGAKMIGNGNLDLRIAIKGNDEFSELATSFNAMTGKLSDSYKELRKEIDERKLAEEALREAKESLERKVRERTTDLQILTEQLEKSRGDLRKLASELVITEERERKRIAGVLHDDIAQILAAARMRLDMLEDIPSDQEHKVKEAKALLQQSLWETRSLMNDLGNPVLIDLGLLAACEALAKQLMEKNPIRIRHDIQDTFKDINMTMKAILYQIIRELLNNVVKHSKAQNAYLVIRKENEHYRVQVTDDGVGFNPRTRGGPTAEGGYGLYSIRERLIAVNGSLNIESAPGTGTVVTAILPETLD